MHTLSSARDGRSKRAALDLGSSRKQNQNAFLFPCVARWFVHFNPSASSSPAKGTWTQSARAQHLYHPSTRLFLRNFANVTGQQKQTVVFRFVNVFGCTLAQQREMMPCRALLCRKPFRLQCLGTPLDLLHKQTSQLNKFCVQVHLPKVWKY